MKARFYLNKSLIVFLCFVFNTLSGDCGAQLKCYPHCKLYVTHNDKYPSYLLIDTIASKGCYESHDNDRYERYRITDSLIAYNRDTAFIGQRFVIFAAGDSLVMYTKNNLRETFYIFCLCWPKEKSFKTAAFYPASSDDVLQWLDTRNRLTNSSTGVRLWQQISGGYSKNKTNLVKERYLEWHQLHKHKCLEDYQKQLALFVTQLEAGK
jgi:hypothetical protein